MVNRNNSRGTPRTPRKDKDWAYHHATKIITANFDSIDLLQSYRTSLDLGQTRSLTVMRMLGSIALVELGSASTPAYVSVRLGFLWQDPNAATLNLVPWGEGTRDALWIQLGYVAGQEPASALADSPVTARPDGAQEWTFDIQQMRSQPTPQHQLRLVYHTNGKQESVVLGLEVRVAMFLALP